MRTKDMYDRGKEKEENWNLVCLEVLQCGAQGILTEGVFFIARKYVWVVKNNVLHPPLQLLINDINLMW